MPTPSGTSSPSGADRIARPRQAAGLDALLILMVLIWGANFSVIKHAFIEIPPQAFNAIRLAIASVVLLAALDWVQRRARTAGARFSPVFYTPAPLTTRDRWDLVWLGVVGHLIYQICFVSGINGTSVSNAALILGATPVVVAVFSAALGRERIGRLHWLGAAVSALGIYFVVGHGASFGGATLKGDLLVIAATVCWAAYTLGTSRLVVRHSPLYITAVTMAIGAGPYALVMVPQVLRVHWAGVGAWTFASLLLSALLALCVAYLIWYAAVQQLGASRTAMYSNVVPIVAMAVAAMWLHEPISSAKMIGAAAVLSGVFLTRIGRTQTAVPMEE